MKVDSLKLVTFKNKEVYILFTFYLRTLNSILKYVFYIFSKYIVLNIFWKGTHFKNIYIRYNIQIYMDIYRFLISAFLVVLGVIFISTQRKLSGLVIEMLLLIHIRVFIVLQTNPTHFLPVLSQKKDAMSCL